MTKAEAMDISLFVKYMEEKTNLDYNSRQAYYQALVTFLKNNPDIDNIDDYNNFLVNGSIKQNCNKYYFALKMYIKYKIPDKALREQLYENLIRPPVRDPVRTTVYLSEEDRMEIINNFKNQKHVVMSLIMSITGARFGDVLRIRKDAYIMEKIHDQMALKLNIIGKRHKKNPVYIYDQVVIELILDWIDNNKDLDEEYLFFDRTITKNPNQTDLALTYKANYLVYLRDLKQAIVNSNVRVNPKHFSSHDFRRSFSRDVWTKYKDPNILQRVLQHQRADTTLRYLRHSGMQNVDILYELQTGKKTGL